MKKIFFVRNRQVWEEISKQVDPATVAGMFDLSYFEKIPGNVLPDEIPLKDIDALGGGDMKS